MESNTLVESASADPASFAASASDTGLLCLVMLARFHGIATELDQLAHEFTESGQPFNNTDILLAAKKRSLKAKLVSTTLPRLTQTPLPCMALLRNGQYVILVRADENQQLIQDPLVGRPQVVTPDEFTERWSGKLILFTSRASLAGELRKFDFSWFIPAVVKYRKLLLEVLAVSLVLQLFALGTPMFFQVVMDKVLVHKGFSTLDVIAMGLLVVVTFEVTLTALRSYVFSHTTSR